MMPARYTTLRDPELLKQVRALARPSGLWAAYHLAFAWLFLGCIMAAAAWFFAEREAWGFSFWWNVPVAGLAVVLVGAGQHRLTILAHEATHRTLFSNRYLNDLLADWLCLFPLLSCLAHLRVQQMSHHRHVNDPQRDGDRMQLHDSGAWPAFPFTAADLHRFLLRWLRLSHWIRYSIVRPKYLATGPGKGAYLRPGWQPTLTHVRLGIIYLLAQAALLVWLVLLGDGLLLAVVPTALAAVMLAFYALIPAGWYYRTRVPMLISFRIVTLGRMLFMTGMMLGIAWVTHLTGRWGIVYFSLLWMLPMSTTLSLFTLWRQLAQHGNAGGAKLTNTRNFAVGPLARLFFLPLGQHLHLAHHLFPRVPHYRLARLHTLLMECEEYRRAGKPVHSLTEAWLAQPVAKPVPRPLRGPSRAAL
jgi:fatty acid desaturase